MGGPAKGEAHYEKDAQILEKNYQLWIMLLPAIVYVFIFCYIPMYGMQLAFREYSFSAGITGGKFVGMKYFTQYFSSPMFLTTLKNTFVIFCGQYTCGISGPYHSRHDDQSDKKQSMEADGADHGLHSVFYIGGGSCIHAEYYAGQ